MSESSPVTGTRPAVPQEFAIIPHSARVPDSHPLKPMPVSDSILWSPTLAGAHRPSPLMFFAQQTLRKIHDRLSAAPNGLGIGLLAGRRYTDNQSGAQFVVIDGALPLATLAAEDEAAGALAEGIQSAGIEVVGWYRSHSFSDAALTASDVEAQTKLFEEPGAPSLVLVVAAGGEAGAVFRQSSSSAWPVEALPLYEWLIEPLKSEGPKPTILRWRNYGAAEPVSRFSPAALAAPAGSAANLPVLFPTDDDVDDEEPAPSVAPSPVTWQKRFLKPAVYVACVLGGAVVVAAASAIINSGDASDTSHGAGSKGDGVAGGPGTAAYAAAVLDRRADTLSLALTAFADRARMFDAKQMTCAGLQRGLQQVEENWLSYNIARRETLAPFDAQREERDRSLYADVRTAERQFERSACARP